MLNHPRFKPHFRVEVVPGEGAFVLAGAKQTLLRGRLYELVVPCLGAGLTADDVCDQLQAQASPAEVYYLLAQLEKSGYLCEEEGSLPAGEAALWSAQQVDPGEATKRLADTTVAVRAIGLDATPLLSLLDALHVRVEEKGRLDIVPVDSYLREDLEGFNAEALRDKRPWLLFRPIGRQVWVGPLFRPGVTGCWECLAQRLRANCPVESYLESKRGPLGVAATDPACSPATLAVAWGLAANAVATWIATGGHPELDGKVHTFDVLTFQSKSHTLIRLPYCPACGTRATGNGEPSGPLTLISRPKNFTEDGGHRVVPPEVTLAKYGHHVSPITGAVSMLERVGPPGDGAMHVYIAGHNLARRHKDLAHLRSDLRNMSSGKGTTDVQARASGLCEGLERFSGVFRGDELRRLARLDQLGDAAIPPGDCLLFSERQYRDRDAWNARKSHFNFVPAPFDPVAEIEWTPVWSLTRNEWRYLPTAFCYFNYRRPKGSEVFCLSDSNGNAAGNTLEEAILQGFLELVERDSVALWWYNRVRRPGVDLDAFADPYPGRLREVLRGLGRDFWALDLTSDLGVPVFAALSRMTGGPEERILLGFGAHFDARVALLRAVTEMNQMLAGSPKESARTGPADPVTDEETLHWLRTATVANQPYLLPDATRPRNAASFPAAPTTDLLQDVRRCQALVERSGMEMLVLDQTRPEIGLPVVKVIVPGLRHFWARFAPGRLYDAPVRLGWLSRPLAEADLNPIPMFL